MKRIYHPWDKWECYYAGMYENKNCTLTKPEGAQAYCDFLSNLVLFESSLYGLTSRWKYSCEHFLTNDGLNRIAWLGQAAAAYHSGLPRTFRGGFKLLSETQQLEANQMADKWLKLTLAKYA
jgi:hypothetical protein